MSPISNVSFALFFTNCLLGIYLHNRVRLAVVVVVAALALYVPYLMLPNHLLGYYFWAGWPMLMLLIPLALTPSSRSEARASR